MRWRPADKPSVGVLIERTSRMVLLARLEDTTTAALALAGFTAAKLNLRPAQPLATGHLRKYQRLAA